MPATTRPSSRPGSGWVPDVPAPDAGRRAHLVALPFAGVVDPDPAGVDVPAAATRARHRAGDRRTVLVPSTVRGGRWRPSPAAAAGAVAVLVVLAVALALRAGALDLVGAPAVPDRAAVTPAVATSEVVDPSGAASTPAVADATSGAGGDVVVHVVGEVARPGLVRVPAGSRVADAVDEAGGAGPLADLGQVNLARPVVDGEQVVLPKQGQSLAAPPAPAPGAPPAAGPLDLNAATLDELDGLDGIGPVLAQRILDWRTANGRFSDVEELGEVQGIGDKLLGRLRDQVRV